jgi:hypothetical protein
MSGNAEEVRIASKNALLARRTAMPGQLKRLHDIRGFTLDAMSVRRVGIDRELLTAVETKVRRVDPSAKRALWFGITIPGAQRTHFRCSEAACLSLRHSEI